MRNNKQATQRKKPLAAKDEQEKLIKEKFTEEEVTELLKEGFTMEQIAYVAKDKIKGDKQCRIIGIILISLHGLFRILNKLSQDIRMRYTKEAVVPMPVIQPCS